jgi:NAD(P)-dependent dehydrogenase (short-subunit alcohol dehydrogenase family)
MHPERLAGRTVLVTGGTSGIGLATASALAGAGAHVVVAARNVDRGRRAVADLPGAVAVLPLDLADLDSVRAFAADWTGPLDVLINNAGISVGSLQRTPAGVELQLATNHLGPYALTNLLLPHVTDRVVTLASLAERQAKLDLTDPGFERTKYTQSRAYNNSKLANLLFVAALQRRLTAAGSPVRALAAHPGFVRTDIYAETSGFVARAMVRALAQGPADGALPVLLAATADLPGGTFTGPEKLAHMRSGAEVIHASARANDPALAEELWQWSARRTGIDFGLPSGTSA